jgi:group I intron endonuclease
MGYIYCITNTINNKKYVGKTLMSVEKRFSEHKKDRHRRNMEKRPLYSAMNKYGTEKFTIEVLESVEDETTLSEREIYWIEKLGTYGKGGYNATKGGDGKQYYDHNEIINLIKAGYTKSQIRNKLNCCFDTIKKIGKKHNLIIRHELSKLVAKFDQNGTKLGIYFGTVQASKHLIKDLNLSISKYAVEASIQRCCTGKLTSAYGFVWKYLPEPE